MGLAKSSFYYKTGEPDLAAVRAGMDIRDRIEALCLDFHGYGYQQVTRQLKYDGYPVNHKKVLRADEGKRPAVPSQAQTDCHNGQPP